MKNYASLWNYLMILLSLVLVKILRWSRATGPCDRSIPWRGGGGWENTFPKKQITCPIPKGACVWPNRVKIHISLLILCSNWNSDKLLFFTVYVDVVYFPNETQHGRLNHQSRVAKERAVGYLTPFFSCQFEHFRLCTIYVRLHGCRGGWSLCYPYFKTEESVHRFRIGLYAWFYSFEEKGEGGRWKDKHCFYFKINAGHFRKLKIDKMQ